MKKLIDTILKNGNLFKSKNENKELSSYSYENEEDIDVVLGKFNQIEF